MAPQGKVVLVTAAESTQSFYCQVTPNPKLDSLMALLKEVVPSLIPGTFKSGDICCAQFSEDEEWYRARVTGVAGDSADVLYLDYGNSETLSLVSLRSLPLKLMKLAPQAKLCCLTRGEDALDDEWPDAAQQPFLDLVLAGEEEMTMLEVDQAGLDGVTPVRLWSGGRDLEVELSSATAPAALELISATAPPPLEINSAIAPAALELISATAPAALPANNLVQQILPVPIVDHQVYEVVVVLDDPTDPCLFQCQLVENAVEFTAIQDRLSKVAAPALGQFEPGQLCMGCSSQDKVLYRAMLESECDGTCHVLFVDFGDREDIPAECLRELPSEFISYPKQAIPAMIHSTSPLQPADLAGVRDDGVFQASFVRRADGQYDMRIAALQDVDSQANGQVGKSPQVNGHANKSPQVNGHADKSPQVNGHVDKSPQVNRQVDTSPQVNGHANKSPQVNDQVSTPLGVSGQAGRVNEQVNGHAGSMSPLPVAAAVTPSVPSGYPLYLNWPRGAVRNVAVSLVESTDSFWVRDDASLKGLENLVRVLKSDMHQKAGSVEVGAHYLVKGSNGEWSRCSCEEIMADATVKVYLYDHGKYQMVSKTDVFQWEAFYGKMLRRVAARCCLSPTIRPNGAQSFPAEMVDRIEALQKRDGVQIKVVGGSTADLLEVVFLQRNVDLTEELLTGKAADIPAAPILPGAIIPARSHIPGRVPKSPAPGPQQKPPTPGGPVQKAITPGGIPAQRTEPPRRPHSVSSTTPTASRPIRQPTTPSSPGKGFLSQLSSRASPTVDSPAFEAAQRQLQSRQQQKSPEFKLEAVKSMRSPSAPSHVSPTPATAAVTMVAPPQQPSAPAAVVSASFPELKISAGSSHALHCVHHDDSLEIYWCQLAENSTHLERIADIILTLPEDSFVPIESVKVGAVCCAPSSDGAWYRAYVQSATGSSATVRFVDFGNTEEVECLGELDEELLSIPMQAVPCTLASPSALLEASEAGISVRFVKQCSNSWTVELSAAETLSAAAPLANAQVDIPALSLPTGQRIGIMVPVFTDPSDFWCQPASTADDLVSLGEALLELCESSPALTSLPGVGSVCCARFTVDEMWYRARVVGHNDDGTCTVFFVDYGNEDTLEADSLRSISSDVCTLPAQAVQCAQKDCSSWSDETGKSFGALAEQLEGVLAEVVSISDGLHNVVLFDSTEEPHVPLITHFE